MIVGKVIKGQDEDERAPAPPFSLNEKRMNRRRAKCGVTGEERAFPSGYIYCE